MTSTRTYTLNHWRLLPQAIVCFIAVLPATMVFGQDQRPANRPTFNPTFDLSTLKPFTDGALYMDKYETNLYPGGNEIPKAHQEAGMRVAAGHGPLELQALLRCPR
jgi:hypothetical protein